MLLLFSNRLIYGIHLDNLADMEPFTKTLHLVTVHKCACLLTLPFLPLLLRALLFETSWSVHQTFFILLHMSSVSLTTVHNSFFSEYHSSSIPFFSLPLLLWTLFLAARWSQATFTSVTQFTCYLSSHYWSWINFTNYPHQLLCLILLLMFFFF